MTPYWTDGQFTVYLGDCREILPQLDLSTVDVTIADPPYNLEIPYESPTGWVKPDALSPAAYEVWTRSWFPAVPQPLVTFIGTKNLAMWHRICDPTWVGAWHKPNSGGGNPIGGFAAWEPILFYGRPNAPAKQDAWSVPLTAQPNGTDRNTPRPGKIRTHGVSTTGTVQKGRHPCPKPLPLMRRILESTTLVGHTVLDPFVGSGTTLRAAKDLGRKGIGIEINEEYCEMTVEYLSQEVLALWELEG